MLIEDIALPKALYKKYLENINGIRFTPREIDVISLTLSGRSSKKIASLLSISPRTVENHIHNIMIKLECNSREGIIDFAEKSGKLSLLKDYYIKSLINSVFEQCLTSLRKSTQEGLLKCDFIFWQSANEPQVSLIHNLLEHLKSTGTAVSLVIQKEKILRGEVVKGEEREKISVLFFPPDVFQEEFKDSFASADKQVSGCKVIVVFEQVPPQEVLSKELSSYDFIDLNTLNNYFYLAFDIIKRISPNGARVEKTLAEFHEKVDALNKFSNYLPQQDTEGKGDIKENPVSKPNGFPRITRNFALVTFLVFGISGGLGLLMLKGYFLSGISGQFTSFYQSFPNTKCNLSSPAEGVLFTRPELLLQLENKMKEVPLKIRTIAVVGVGGSGKTTLTHQFARLQKAAVIWEINAESQESLIRSFESLAYALSKTEEQKKGLKRLQDVKDPLEREEKIIQIVKETLKSVPNWLLIYDNVERFSDIQNYFPSDSDTWGSGEIIITTRDSNIRNNNHVNGVIEIGELLPEARLNFFIKIMNHGRTVPLGHSEQEKARFFLDSIPPFPLDILSAAYYLKATNISYEKYLEHLSEQNRDFANLQENVLKETSGYAKTRYGILSLSLKNLMGTHEDFGNLLLFISLLDSQNIPRNLLDRFKSDVVVDSFIYYLKNYSLITPQSLTPFSAVATFSMHRSTQEITLAYLIRALQHKKEEGVFQLIGNTLDCYMGEVMNREDFPKMKEIAIHAEMFLTHRDLFDDRTLSVVGGTLGGIYFYLGHYVKAKQILESSLMSLKKEYRKNYSQIAQILSYLGIVSRELGHYKEAYDLLEQSLRIYERHLPKNYSGMARAKAYLGMVSRELGNYEEAKIFLKESLQIYQSKLPDYHVGKARVLGYIGIVSRELCNFDEAINLLEQSLATYQQYLPENHLGRAWALIHLGKVYKELGRFDKAKNFIEDGLKIFNQHLPENHFAWVMVYLGGVYKDLGKVEDAKRLFNQSLSIYKRSLPENHVYIGWSLANLGSLYNDTGDYEKAQNLLENAYIIYEKYYPRGHIEIGRILNEMGRNYLLNGKLSEAQSHINQALKVFELRHHPEKYISLEILAEIYVKTSQQVTCSPHLSQELKQQALNSLKQANLVVKQSFSKDSSQQARILDKIKLPQ
jgi:tetratricopeptide (TPR) repeat protein/DNA-binding CsgD family transcriptional regulator